MNFFSKYFLASIATVNVIVSVMVTLSGASFAYADQKMHVCVYFDSSAEKPSYHLGELYAVMVRNLLGHFKEVTHESRAIVNYKSGDLNSCQKLVYIGSYYNAAIPSEFFQDVSKLKSNVLWINYNIWLMQKALGVDKFKELFGFEGLSLVGYDQPPSEKNQTPDFYKFFHYKGETFEKIEYYDNYLKKTVASPEIFLTRVSQGANGQGATVLSEAEHSQSKNKTPYVLRKNNFFYVADMPLAYIHESDRYLILTDLLFDFLELKPRLKSKYAMLRVEDIHPLYMPQLIYRVTNEFRNKIQKGKVGIPFVLSVIPKYVDPYGYAHNGTTSLEFWQNPEMVKALKYAASNGGRVIMHGYTHQSKETPNCGTGVSGDDFEFWDSCDLKPVPEESVSWVRNRLDKGMEILKKMGMVPLAWLTPHYQASPLVNKVFGEYFQRTIGRVRYTPDGVDPADKINWAGQFFPYTIEKDYYGQWVWPENVGNIKVKYPGSAGLNIRTTEQMELSIKQNKVIRDAWASYFWHPNPNYAYLEGFESLSKLIDYTIKEGYEFVDIAELIKRGE